MKKYLIIDELLNVWEEIYEKRVTYFRFFCIKGK